MTDEKLHHYAVVRGWAAPDTPGTTDSPDFSTCRDPRAPEMHQCRHSDPQVGGESEDTRTVRELREELQRTWKDLKWAREKLSEVITENTELRLMLFSL